MRIETQGFEKNISSLTRTSTTLKVEDVPETTEYIKSRKLDSSHNSVNDSEEGSEALNKGKLKEAVDSINDFLEVQQKSSKFIFHEGLDKYYVQLVDVKTEEIIKEIPPERLLNAFYEMQKMLGMIVDEKI